MRMISEEPEKRRTANQAIFELEQIIKNKNNKKENKNKIKNQN